MGELARGVQLARQAVVQGGDRHIYLHQATARHLAQDVQVARDQRVLGDDSYRQLALPQHLQHRTRDAQLALGGLVRIGIGAQHYQAGLVTRLGQLGAQQFCRVGFGKNLRLKVQARAQAQVGMRGPRIAIDAAMLAALVGVDALLKANVGRLVAADDGAGVSQGDCGLGAGQVVRVLFVIPWPIHVFWQQGFPLVCIKARAGVGERAATFDEVNGVYQGHVSDAARTVYVRYLQSQTTQLLPPMHTSFLTTQAIVQTAVFLSRHKCTER